MLLFAHLGIGLGLAWLLAWRAPSRVDYRLILLGAILPDLIDKPLGFALGLETRLWGHTFAFLLALLAASVVLDRPALRFLGFGAATHLLLDSMWTQPDVVLWPAYGWAFPAAAFDPELWLEALLRNPFLQAGEIAGIAVLALFAWTHGVRSWTTFRAFMRRGTFPAAD